MRVTSTLSFVVRPISIRPEMIESCPHVRAAAAADAVALAPALGRDAAVAHLLPVVLSLLRDDVPDVRLAVISRLDTINQARRRWGWGCSVCGLVGL